MQVTLTEPCDPGKLLPQNKAFWTYLGKLIKNHVTRKDNTSKQFTIITEHVFVSIFI